MENKSLTKIFHYARFDVAILKENLNINVKNIFCTKKIKFNDIGLLIVYSIRFN